MSAISTGISNKITGMSLLCALLVVFIHLNHVPKEVGSLAWMVWYFVRYGLATIAVPYFFVISGYFLARHCEDIGWWKSAVRSRFNTLVVPFIVWNVITLLYGYSMAGLCFLIRGHAAWIPPSIKGLLTSFGINPFCGPACGPLWYVRALCLFVFLSPIIIWCVKRWGWKVLPVLYVFYIVVNPGHVDIDNFWVCPKWRSFWRFGFSVEGLFYFTVGISLHVLRLSVSKRIGLLFGCVGVTLACTRMFLKMQGLNDSGYLVPLAIPLVMMGVWQIIGSSDRVKTLAGLSFPIYVMHSIMLSAFSIVYKNVLTSLSQECGLLMIIEWLFAVVLSICCACMLRKVLPSVSRVAFGGR